MNQQKKLSGPVVVGGTGGSGTRVVAEILRESNVYMGENLNPSLDNLWFNWLFKDSPWLNRQNRKGGGEIRRRLQAFNRYSNPDENTNLRDRFLLAQKVFSYISWEIKKGRPFRIKDQLVRYVNNLRFSKKGITFWGWKEPSSLIYLPRLNEFFDKIRYIHIIRHGLDMAYSSNQDSLKTWHQHFGISKPLVHKNLRLASFEFWYRSNRRTVDYGTREMRDKFLLIKFERLCNATEIEVQKILNFLDLSREDVDLNVLLNIPKDPGTIGRYKERNFESIFDNPEEKLKELNYSM